MLFIVYDKRDEDIQFEVDEFWIKDPCLSDISIIWIHEEYKGKPWKEIKQNCSCVTTSNVPRVKCFDVVYEFNAFLKRKSM